MPRQRPLAGQRGRARLGQPASDRSARPALDRATAGRRTAVLDRTSPPAAAAPHGGQAPRRPALPGRRGDLLLLGALLVVAVLVLTAVALAVRARGAQRTERSRERAVAAAEPLAVDLLSYDYRSLDRDFARARRGLTGRFAGDYRTTSEKVVRPTAEQVKAVVKADVVSSSVVRAAPEEVVVLLFVNQTTTSTRLDGPRVDLNRVRMTMRRVDGQWKVSAVTAL